MAKFYIVAKEKDDYSLITINKGKCLEDIDLLTNNFNSKEEFLKYLKRRGYQFAEEVDLFIVNKGRKEIYHRDLIFGNLDLSLLAKKSKEKKLDVTDTCDALLQRAKEDFDLQDLIRKEAFDLYGDLRTIILNSLRNKKIRISSSKNWMRQNYYVGRDSVAAIDKYDKEKLNDFSAEKFVKKQRELARYRQSIDKYLVNKIDCDNEQISLMGEPLTYINLTYINAEKLAEPTSKKVKRMKKMGIPNEKIIDKLTIPYEIITEDIDYRFSNSITKCLLDLPYHKIQWGQKERYEVDFSKWSNETGIVLNESDMKFLNGLLDTKLRHDAYWYKYYHNQLYQTAATRREENSYRKSVNDKLRNSASKHGEAYQKAYNFYLVLQEMTKDKEDSRGSYGR